jgi:predicted peroxiredoxin
MKLISRLMQLFKKKQPKARNVPNYAWAVKVAELALARNCPVIVLSRSLPVLQEFADLCASKGVRAYIARASSKVFPYKLEELAAAKHAVCVSRVLATTGWRHRGSFPTGAHFILLDETVTDPEVTQLLARFMPNVATLLWTKQIRGVVACCRRSGVSYLEHDVLKLDETKEFNKAFQSIVKHAMNSSYQSGI